MLKKFIPIVFAAAAVMLPTAPAAAWEQVCMKLPLWKTWFAGTLNVLHGFRAGDEIPSSYVGPDGVLQPVPAELHNSQGHNRADGLITSGSIRVNQSKCVDISGVAEGEPFLVYVDIGTYRGARICATHPSNPDWWYLQTRRPYRTLWYEAWGDAGSPKCAFKHEAK